jgi:hypothetical protein
MANNPRFRIDNGQFAEQCRIAEKWALKQIPRVGDTFSRLYDDGTVLKIAKVTWVLGECFVELERVEP